MFTFWFSDYLKRYITLLSLNNLLLFFEAEHPDGQILN